MIKKEFPDLTTKPPQYTKPVRFAQGNFGEIFKAYDFQNNRDIAIKVERKQKNLTQTLQNEAIIMERLKGIEGIPELLCFSEEDCYTILFMPLYGKNMKEFFTKSFSYPWYKSLSMVSELIMILQAIHDRNIVHRDLKPANILLSSDEKSFILIDFGLAALYKTDAGEHIKDRTTNQYIGNLRFGSINSHLFREISRKDDLESLGYMLIYFLKQKLPWDGMDIKDQRVKIKEMGRVKATIDLHLLCSGLPSEIYDYMNYVKKLKFDEKPNYSYLYKIINEAMIKTRNSEEIHVNIVNNRVQSYPLLEKPGEKMKKMSCSQGNDMDRGEDFGMSEGDEESFR